MRSISEKMLVVKIMGRLLDGVSWPPVHHFGEINMVTVHAAALFFNQKIKLINVFQAISRILSGFMRSISREEAAHNV